MVAHVLFHLWTQWIMRQTLLYKYIYVIYTNEGWVTLSICYPSQSFNHKKAVSGAKYSFALNWRQYYSSIVSVLVLICLPVLLWRYSERLSTLSKDKNIILDTSLLFQVPFYLFWKVSTCVFSVGTFILERCKDNFKECVLIVM